MSRLKNNQQGSVIASILIITVFLTSLVASLIILSNSNLTRAKTRLLLLQAQYSAESGADTAVAQLNAGNSSYAGSGGQVTVLVTTRFKTTFSTTLVTNNSKEKVITSVGRVFTPATATNPSYTRTIQVTAQRSSTNAATSVMSRNIIDIASGVKNIWGIDIYANGFINMSKNTTNLIAENITVAGKNTGATNCSIGGAGNLLKPTSFSHVGQTKTKIVVGYNNCMSPPGNSSNANFDVTANTSVSTISSTYIPWNQYMDSSYTSGNCTDWTNGGSTKNIPNANGSKKTHYPDSGSNISASCGSSGNLDLGSNRFNINDNVHIRANLCKTSACDPTFYNPNSTMKFIFVEGTVNFQSVNTVSGSGPIALITYGTDPNSHGSACPSNRGDSLYLGQHGSTKSIAPALYLLAQNGLCIDGTKFDNTNPSLGGVSGKNIYIAASPGNPYDLVLDPNFPTSQIPVDLSWRAVRYRRI